MESDTPNLNVVHFSFSDDSLPEWENELGVSDTDLVSCAEAVEKEEIEKSTRFPKLSRYDLQNIVTNAESKGSKRNTKWFVKLFEGKGTP